MAWWMLFPWSSAWRRPVSSFEKKSSPP
jgi:hypothetical protein